MERLPDAVVQLVVDDGAPVLRLFVSNRLHIWKATMETLQPNSAGTQARGVKSHNPCRVTLSRIISTQDSEATKAGTRYEQKSAGSSWAHPKQCPNILAPFSYNMPQCMFTDSREMVQLYNSAFFPIQ